MSRCIHRLQYVVSGIALLALAAGMGCGPGSVPQRGAAIPATTQPPGPPDGHPGQQQTALKPVMTADGPAAELPAADSSASDAHPNTAPENQAVKAFAPAADAVPPGKKLTWEEVEKLFAELREKSNGDELDVFYTQLTHPSFTRSKDYAQHIERLQEWRDDHPQSPTPLIALGGSYILYAWQARGSGWANSVTEEGWALFHERLDLAHKALEKSIELGIQDARVYSDLITIAMGKGLPIEQAYEWVDKGCQLDPTYYQLYTKMAVLLLPRWQGEPGDVAQFAEDMLAAIPGDDGLEAYGRIALEMLQYGGERQMLFSGGFDHAKLLKAGELLVKRHPKSNQIAHFAALCTWIAQDRQAARKIQPKLGNVAKEDCIWPSEPYYQLFVKWCEADEKPAPAANQVLWGELYSRPHLAFSSDPRYLWATGGNGPSTFQLLDVQERKLLVSLPGPRATVEHLQLDNRRNRIAAALRGEEFTGIVIVNLDEPGEPAGFRIEPRCLSVALNPVDDQIGWTEEKKVHFADILTGERIKTIEFPAVVMHLLYSTDGKKFAVRAPRSEIWDVATGKKLIALPHADMQPAPPTNCIRVLEIDSEGRALAIARVQGPGASLIRYSADAQKWDTIADLGAFVIPESAVLSPDRQLLAAPLMVPDRRPFMQEIGVWDLATGKQTQHFIPNCTSVRSLAFSPDGKLLASSSELGGLIKLWPLKGTATP